MPCTPDSLPAALTSGISIYYWVLACALNGLEREEMKEDTQLLNAGKV